MTFNESTYCKSYHTHYLDSYSKWIRQKFFKGFINEKFKKRFYFFTCILPDYVSHESPKEFWKNKYFENMRAVFLLRCQNPLRWEISLICHWNIDSWKQKLSFVYDMVPQNDQNIIYIQCRLYLVRIITIKGHYL